MGKTKGLTNEECHNRRAIMAEQVRQGKSVAEVARIHKVALACVYGACSIQGILPPKRVSIQRAFRVLRFLYEQKTLNGIAHSCHLSYNQVKRIAGWAASAGLWSPKKKKKKTKGDKR